jgi:N-acetylglucosaminyldiphosphoundecaprenol N-acetyl-beta-D-mannosaminyltransferase
VGSDIPTSIRRHEHADVLGVAVSAVNMERAVQLAEEWIDSGENGYVCVTGVHGVMEAQADSDFLSILNAAAINVPDGMPMSWVGHIQGFKTMDRVYGPDFMLEMCTISVERGYRHFLYGGQEGVAQLLAQRLQERFPGLQIAGTYTPPFRALNGQEEQDLLRLVAESKPHMLWVGLSTPKQERFMANFGARLNVPLLVGVGAAFDIHTGRSKDAPAWIKRAGLQWFHRLLQEPRRLGRRYLVNNPRFMVKITRQLLTKKKPLNAE